MNQHAARRSNLVSSAGAAAVTFPQQAVTAQSVAALPGADTLPGGAAYERQWGGRRALMFVHHGRCRLQSRTGRDITRMYPAIAAAAVEHVSSGVVLDGELVREAGDGVRYVANDLLAGAGMDMRASPFRVRRHALMMTLDDAPAPLAVTPTTRDRREARAWLAAADDGSSSLTGVTAKGLATPYSADGADWQQVRHGASTAPLRVVDAV